MLRSVFLRFPLFIHPHSGGWVQCREKTHARLYTPIYTGTGTGRRVKHIVHNIYTAAVAGALHENRQYFCRAKNGGGGGSKTMWTPPLPSLLTLPHPGPSFIDPAGWRVPIGRAPGRLRPSHTFPPLASLTRRSPSPRDTRSGVIDVFRPPSVHAHIYYQKRRRRIRRTPAIYYYDGFPKTVFSNSLSVIRSFSPYNPHPGPTTS